MKAVGFLRTKRLYYGGLFLGGATAALLLTSLFAASLRQKADPTPSTSRLEQFALLPRNISSPKPTPALTKICFARGDFIYLKEVTSAKETKLLMGQWPEISPDGKKLLFMSGKSNDIADPWRIRLLDLSSRRVQEFPKLSGRSAYSAHWTSDGSAIAFQTVDSSRGDPVVGLLDPLTGDWRIIIGSEDLGVADGDIFTFNSWGPRDQSVLIHSLKHLYQVSLNGKLVWQMPITDLGIDSETRFSLSADGRYLLFDSLIDTKERPVNDTVKILDISTKQVATITPDTIEARTPMWLPSEKGIIFTCMKRFDNPHRPSICRIGIDGKDLSVLVRNANQVSYSSR